MKGLTTMKTSLSRLHDLNLLAARERAAERAKAARERAAERAKAGVSGCARWVASSNGQTHTLRFSSNAVLVVRATGKKWTPIVAYFGTEEQCEPQWSLDAAKKLAWIRLSRKIDAAADLTKKPEPAACALGCEDACKADLQGCPSECASVSHRAAMRKAECSACGGFGEVSGEAPGVACPVCAGTGKAEPHQQRSNYEEGA